MFVKCKVDFEEERDDVFMLGLMFFVKVFLVVESLKVMDEKSSFGEKVELVVNMNVNILGSELVVLIFVLLVLFFILVMVFR